ncbi:MAG: zinc-ribbon domain-containing protein [Candidatus Kryptonium sp.]
MKCKNCGEELYRGEKFCHNCGSKIEMVNNFCVNCGSKLETGDKFCSTCGHPVELAENIQEIDKPRKTKYRSAYGFQNDKVVKIIFTSVISFVVLVLLFYFYTNYETKKQRVSSSKVTSINVTSEIEAKVYEVASKFTCGCGQCGNLPLETCDCTYAIQQKNFIKERLLKGETVDDVIIVVNQTYGNIKPEFKNKFGTKLELKLK